MTPRRVTLLPPSELHAWTERGNDFVLLDVRDPDEIRIAALPGAFALPMGELAERVGEVPSGKPVVVMCHYGGRSARAAAFLAANGFDAVYDLEGGIDAYAADVDRSIARY